MKTAVILAGGKGTRLRPYTISLPKPLVPVGEKPILEIIISQLKKQGFEHVIITVNHQASIIMAYFEDGAKWGIKITYSLENQALGTMGPLKLLDEHSLPDNFLVMNGDVLSDIDYGNFLDQHIQNCALFTISSYRRNQLVDYGVLETKDGFLTAFQEKPQLPYCVSMGVYALKKEILQFIPKDEYFGFDALVLKLLKLRQKVSVLEYSGYWMDIGRPKDYEQAILDLESGKFLY